MIVNTGDGSGIERDEFDVQTVVVKRLPREVSWRLTSSRPSEGEVPKARR